MTPDALHPVIARRSVVMVNAHGEASEFEIQVGMPFQTSDDDFCCELTADNILFQGKQKVFGIDEIDALDYAIQFIDEAAVHYRDGSLRWADGTRYKRVPSDRKYEWGV